MYNIFSNWKIITQYYQILNYEEEILQTITVNVGTYASHFVVVPIL